MSFRRRDSTHWRSASWRDSDAGYANGRFAMDINAIWAPRALEAIARILQVLPFPGISAREPECSREIPRINRPWMNTRGTRLVYSSASASGRAPGVTSL